MARARDGRPPATASERGRRDGEASREMAAGAAAEVDDPSLAATLEKFRLYETRAVST